MEYLYHRKERIPLIGFGTYRLGESSRTAETAALRHGIESLGMTLLDTAEMYGGGLSEEILGQVIKDMDREKLFIVDKILPQNADRGAFRESCERSLRLLGTDRIDLYLLHWRGRAALQETVDQLEALVRSGLIRHWGVSNFDTHEMEELFACEGGRNCFCNQILYNITERGAEFDLIPWCREHDVLVIAYSPLCNSSEARLRAAGDPLIRRLAEDEGKTAESLMLSFVIRNRDIAAIFKTSSTEHLKADMQNVFAPIPEGDMLQINKRFKEPTHKYPLEKI